MLEKASKMSGSATLERPETLSAEDDSVKRRQIIEGARVVFLSQGFDAASMNDIARTAGVSKGTLYVYFKHKEQLFAAIVEQECASQAEGIFDFDPNVTTRSICCGLDLRMKLYAIDLNSIAW